jgi:hypothetical protein
VNQVTIQAPQNSAKAEVPTRGGVPLGESNIVEIRWQEPDLLNFFRSPNQVVLVFAVQSAERPDDIPDISAHSKIRDPAYIDGHLHS